MKIQLNKIKSLFNDSVGKVDFSAALSFLSQDELLKWLKQFTETAETVYDKAMDANYLKDKIGSYNHRMFDGGHDPVGAWEAVKNASDTDTFSQEVIGYAQSMFKDMSTIQGMPFLKIDKNWYDQSSEWLTSTIPESSKDWLRDLLTYDSFEILASSLGVVGAMFCLKKGDMDKLSHILGSMGIISLLSLNPLMGIAVVFITAYAYYNKKEKLDTKSLSQGMATATISWIIFSVLGLPILIELIIVIVILKVLKNYSYSVKDIMNAIITRWNNLKGKNRGNIILPRLP